MTERFFDEAEIAITCPKCSEKTKKTLGWVKANDRLTCPACGHDFALDKDQLRRDHEALEKALSDLTTRFPWIKKR